MNTPADHQALENLERLQAELSTRESTAHFAHAAASMLAALIAAGAAAKLFWDLMVEHLYLGAAVWGVAVVLATYSVVRYRIGKRVLAVEARRYEELLAMRGALRLDDPSALLPR